MNTTKRTFKSLIQAAATSLIACLIYAGPVLAQSDADGRLLGPNRFDVDNPAIAVANEDVPPEILSVSFYPAEPQAGRPTIAAAEIRVNPDESENVVTDAQALYRVDGAADWSVVPLAQSPSNDRLWMGEIPPQAAGAQIEVAIHAASSDGNRVMETPPTVSEWPPKPSEMFLVADDGADVIEPYPASMDIDKFLIGLDEARLYTLATFQDKTARSTNEVFAHAYGSGIVCPTNHWQRQINHELAYSKAIMYLPLMTMKGFYNEITGMGAEPDADIDVKASGKMLAMGAELKNFCSPEELEKGFKIFYATGVVNMRRPDAPEAVDVSAMAMIYPRSHKLAVK